MAALQKISQRWSDFCIVAGSGPSLTLEVAQACRGYPVIAVNDAYRLLPFADVLYACDNEWWDIHGGCPDFAGERWSSHGSPIKNEKRATAARYGLKLIRGGDGEGFARDPGLIHYGEMGGFQATNIALHMIGWKGRVALVGFDLGPRDGRRHFFGEHPKGLRSTMTGPHGAYEKCIGFFTRAKVMLPPEVEIVNCTHGSALRSFKMMGLAEALPKEQRYA